MSEKSILKDQIKNHMLVAQDNLCSAFSALASLNQSEGTILYAIQKAKVAACNAEYNSLCESYNDLSREELFLQKEDSAETYLYLHTF